MHCKSPNEENGKDRLLADAQKAGEDTAALANQGIFHYYQEKGCWTFSESIPRLNYLVKVIGILSRNARPRILNIGIGNGYLEKTAKLKGWDVCSLDPDKQAVDQLRVTGIDARHGSIEAMPFDSLSFDFVIASEVLEHLTDEQLQRGLQEVSRVLNIPGFFLGTVPYKEDLSRQIVFCPRCGEAFHRWGHQRAFDEKVLKVVLSKFFTGLRMKTTFYVSFDRAGIYNLISNVGRFVLAKIRMPISTTSLFFVARNGSRES